MYTGFWKEDNFSGNGTLVWKSGAKYEGQLINGELTGHGELYSSSGELHHDGFFRKGIFLGKNNLVLVITSTGLMSARDKH